MKSKIFSAVLSLAVLPVFLLGSATIASAKAVELTYANFFPPFHIQSKLAESWCKEVEKRTNGAIKINYYPAIQHKYEYIMMTEKN